MLSDSKLPLLEAKEKWVSMNEIREKVKTAISTMTVTLQEG
jgi:hypothetical protein